MFLWPVPRCEFVHLRHFIAHENHHSQVYLEPGSHGYRQRFQVRFSTHAAGQRSINSLLYPALLRSHQLLILGHGVPPESVPQALGVLKNQGIVVPSQEPQMRPTHRNQGLNQLWMILSTSIQTLMEV